MVSVSKGIFHALAASKGMKSLASRYGLRTERSFARRFVAGESVADAIAAARRIEAAGMSQTLDFLGESVATMAEADRATRAYLATINEIAAAGIGRNLSLKLTQLGLTVDRATCVDNLRRILDGATPHDFFVRIDMEDSRYTQVTFDIFETLWQQGYRNAGMVVQSYLPRTLEDVRRMNALGARVRLVKGAYREPRRVAYQSKAQVDAAFIEIMQRAAHRGDLPGDRDARSGDARRDPGVRARARTSARNATSSRCSTACGATCRRNSRRRATGCGFTSRSARSGFPTSCAASASGRRTSASWSAACCANLPAEAGSHKSCRSAEPEATAPCRSIPGSSRQPDSCPWLPASAGRSRWNVVAHDE